MSDGHNPIDHAAQEAEREQLNKEKHLKQLQKDEDLHSLMSVPWGRRVVWNLLAQAGVHRSPFVPGERETDFNLGMQNFGLLLQAEINRVCPDLYITMLQELSKRG